ncbi:MAG: glycosyltransferase, partial [Candidatus Parvarchaeum sp.]|nr:glycosyltransferase [Candidatus Parvarchaeum tengchongense]
IEKVAGKKVILSIGRLSENQKRFSVAISAMKELTKSGENFLYLIAGDGPDKERYQKMINSLQLQDKVLLLGFINEDEKSFLLSVSKAVLIVSDRETFGLSMAEALRFGVPVVSTKTSGSLDFIENGKNGFLVDSDAKEISKKISYILKLKNKEYNKMKINSEKSCSKLKPEIATKNIKKRIEELLK